MEDVMSLVNPTVKKFFEHDALDYYGGLEKINW